MNRDPGQLKKIKDEREAAAAKLDAAVYQIKHGHKRPTMKINRRFLCCGGEEVDTIRYYFKVCGWGLERVAVGCREC